MSGLNVPRAGKGWVWWWPCVGRHLSPHCSSSNVVEPSRRAGAEFNATQFLRVARELREDYSSRGQDESRSKHNGRRPHPRVAASLRDALGLNRRERNGASLN